MKMILSLLIISLVFIIAVNALSPSDVVMMAKEPEKPMISVQGISASVFETEPFAKEWKASTPFADNGKRNFTGLPVSDSIKSANAAEEWANEIPKMFPDLNESFHKNDTTVQILGPVSAESGMTVEEFLNG